MSAVFSYRGVEGLIVLTDGAVYDKDGIIRFIERKIDVSERIPLAVTTRGDRDIGDLLSAKVIATVERLGFDDGLRGLRDVAHQWRDAIGDIEGRFTEVLVAGIAGDGTPQHYVLVTEDTPDSHAFEWTDPGQTFSGLNGGEDKPGTFTMEGIGLRNPLRGETLVEYFSAIGPGMFDHFRRIRLKSNGYFCVGGQVDMTIVRLGGVTVETIHRWNDKIGELIDPSKDRPAAAAAGLSRQQRRAAAREARRVAKAA